MVEMLNVGRNLTISSHWLTPGVLKMPRLTASFGSIGLLMQPIIATIFGALIFAEYLNLMQLGFVILALVGIYFARLEINPPNKEGHDELSNQSTRA